MFKIIKYQFNLVTKSVGLHRIYLRTLMRSKTAEARGQVMEIPMAKVDTMEEGASATPDRLKLVGQMDDPQSPIAEKMRTLRKSKQRQQRSKSKFEGMDPTQ